MKEQYFLIKFEGGNVTIEAVDEMKDMSLNVNTIDSFINDVGVPMKGLDFYRKALVIKGTIVLPKAKIVVTEWA